MTATTPTEVFGKNTFTCSATLKMDKKERKRYDKHLNPLSRPYGISPKKKVAWRITKKWFNRYQLPQLLGRLITATPRDGKNRVSAVITGAKIRKAGGHMCTYDITAKPYHYEDTSEL